MARKRRKFSPEFKVDAVREMLTGAKTAGEICRERDITDGAIVSLEERVAGLAHSG